ncbi:class I SAM-dependent methyltransferase [Roseofilum casamattae]|uniref:Class I SAM-dependent methyltransferase n=1 Tax=Roseofilum casamattae BLCC-M143 TaxID=3022442 RepID=A0ABT7BX67_9CYAN|nr:class I SAM-dependent methyltransferase [Roseofilum casamattae]MDJ1183665.1 class I SAM-dependent methyltransferase [Roseofilum casamattae BLCC-M143]
MSYSERLLQQGNTLTRVAHRSRFQAVLNVLGDRKYSRALDYGCGDGWLLRVAYEQGAIESGFGIDIAPEMIAASQETLKDIPGFQLGFPPDTTTLISPQSLDLVFCTETLEHVCDPEAVLDTVLPLCQPNATLVISVPIEVGPSLLVKQTGRYLANLKGGYGYERYTPSELFSAAILWDCKSFPSSHADRLSYRAHKGFDYRDLEALLQEKIAVEKKLFSPFPMMGSLFNSTAIWVGKTL